jgi:hypothetical protein
LIKMELLFCCGAIWDGLEASNALQPVMLRPAAISRYALRPSVTAAAH